MEGETRGKMLQRHKKELLELKKGKGGRGLGKKELASKEAEMKERHEKELMSLHEVEANGVEEHTVDKELQEMDSAPPENAADEETKQKGKGMSRAQKRRIAKEKEREEIQRQIEEDIKKGGPDVRAMENERLQVRLMERNLRVKEIRPDGDCMFAAMSDQLLLKGHTQQPSTREVRSLVVQHLRENKDEYLPFVADSDGAFEAYLKEMSEAAWGGQVELQALAKIFATRIHVMSADGELVMGDDGLAHDVHLSYHRHAYTLGEHYNSLHPNEDSNL